MASERASEHVLGATGQTKVSSCVGRVLGAAAAFPSAAATPLQAPSTAPAANSKPSVAVAAAAEAAAAPMITSEETAATAAVDNTVETLPSSCGTSPGGVCSGSLTISASWSTPARAFRAALIPMLITTSLNIY
ncbi:hypothetical protein TYRP_010486 [Tyrophagus putrescentiae]|nr:hypothetical protein TYRP_010486 [Tyrophagus putrescentiae]